MSATRGMFKQAVAWGLLTYNPCAQIKRIPEKRKETQCYTEEEIISLLGASEGRDKMLLTLAVVSGLREGEIIGLQWGDIDWDKNLISIRRTFLDGQFHEPKTDYAMRDVDMSDLLKEELSQYYIECGEPGAETLVFPNNKGKPLNRHNVLSRIHGGAVERAGIRYFPFHSLRHTYASLLLGNGANILYVSPQLGHSGIQITLDHYAHLMRSDSSQRKILNSFTRKLLGSENEQKRSPSEKGHPGKLLVARGGIEPPTPGFSVLRSTD
jgi:integrase